MYLVPKYEYALLLVGDFLVFTASLWVTLAVRYGSIPTPHVLSLHAFPFLVLFLVWVAVFFLAGLYGRQTRLFRSQLLPTIFYTQVINVILASLFFFFIPAFGITPKTILLIYLVVSTLLIFAWRLFVFPRLSFGTRSKGMLIASGPDAKALVEEIASDSRYPFYFSHVIDTKQVQSHEVIQQACRVIEEDSYAFLVVDFADPAVSAALPIVYDAAFEKQQFALINVVDLYQEVFGRVPLSFVDYAWVLGRVSHSRVYDSLKRGVDIMSATIVGLLTLPLYPFVALAVKVDDGGEVFIVQERIGMNHRPIHILKFRSMSGSDKGDEVLKSTLQITRVGKFLRRTRIDELPQVWNVLKGDLSFVGPRPELPALAAHYNARIPYYNARYLMAPGLTGWAQIKHDTHPHHGSDVSATKEKLSYDLYYFEHRSLFLDLFVMLQTIRIIVTAKGS